MAKKKRKTKLFEWQEKAKLGGVCAKCKRELPRLTVDHIVPILFVKSLDDGDTLIYEDEENFQLVCSPCNQMKSGKFDFTNPKTAQVIYKYIKGYLI